MQQLHSNELYSFYNLVPKVACKKEAIPFTAKTDPTSFAFTAMPSSVSAMHKLFANITIGPMDPPSDNSRCCIMFNIFLITDG